jgi:hypothetical protein
MDQVDKSLQEFQNIADSQFCEKEQLQGPISMKVMMDILRWIHVGQLKTVPALIVQLHAIVKQPITEDGKSVYYGLFLDQHLPYLLAYLVSGIAHKSTDNRRSKLFFAEGLKMVDVESKKEVLYQTPNDWMKIQQTLKLLHVFLSIHLIEVCILRCELVEAFYELMAITEHCCQDPDLLHQFKEHLMLDWAILLQCSGDFERSKILFARLEHNPVLCWVAKTSLFLMNEGTVHYSHLG